MHYISLLVYKSQRIGGIPHILALLIGSILWHMTLAGANAAIPERNHSTLYILRSSFGVVQSNTSILKSGTRDIDCGTRCLARLPLDTNVTLTAMPNAGYIFAGWRYNCKNSVTVTCALEMDGGTKFAAPIFRKNTTGVIPTTPSTPVTTPVTTPTTPTPINAICGTANGTTVSTLPTTNLCTTGTPSSVVGSGPWVWSCGGLSGGNSVSCSANKTPTSTIPVRAPTTPTASNTPVPYFSVGKPKMGANFWHVGWDDRSQYFTTNVNWITTTNPWDAKFLADLAPYSFLRFMESVPTNNSTESNWANRIKKTDDHYKTLGIALEWQIDLCNRLQKDCWFTLPHLATDDYIRQFAILIKANLNPNLKAYIEYSNELWNNIFTQARYATSQANALGLPTTSAGYIQKGAAFGVYRSLQTFKIFRDVYGNEMSTRVIRVISGFGTWFTPYEEALNNILKSTKWNPNNETADMLAIAPYVGQSLNGSASNIQSLFRDSTNSIVKNQIIGVSNVAKKFGIPLGTYEFGQHLTQSADLWSRNPAIYGEYTYMMDQMAPYFAVLAQYAHTSRYGGGGAWGVKLNQNQPLSEAHKYRAIVDWVSKNPYSNTTIGGTRGTTPTTPTTPTPINAICGTANGTTVSTLPTTNLCTTGTPSSVVGSGPWVWSCGGLSGGNSVSCSANKTPTSTIPVRAPTTPVTPPTVPTTSGYDLIVTDITVSPLTPIVGQAAVVSVTFKNQGNVSLPSGSNIGVALFEGSTWKTWVGYYNGLSAGQSITVSTNSRAGGMGNGGNWIPGRAGNISLVAHIDDLNRLPNEASETNNKTTKIVAVNRSGTTPTTPTPTPINAVCGSSNGATFSSVPTTNLCSVGTMSSVTQGTSAYSWSCGGLNGGRSVSCSAKKTATTTPTPTPINAVCGSSNGATFSSVPTTNLCSVGTMSSVTQGTSAYSWSCGGLNGGRSVSCSAKKTATTTPTPVNGVCGSAANQTFSTVPTANLCSSGPVSGFMDMGSSYMWSCGGINNGATVGCGAKKTTTTPSTGMSMEGMTYVNPALIPTARAGSSTFDIVNTGEMPKGDAGGIGAFRNVCQYSHMNFDDPIVFPGIKNATHLHTFWGNTGVDYLTTNSSLLNNGAGTCRGGTANRSGYWIPSLIDTREGRPLAPRRINVYYKTGYNGIKNNEVKAWPEGFRMIAGNPKSTGQQSHIKFTCDGDWRGNSLIPSNCRSRMDMSISFPQCWDGKNLDSADHQSHVAYTVNGRCPSTHPIATPELSYIITYEGLNGSATLRLSSDRNSAPAGSSAHADWMHGWKQELMQTFVTKVINPGLSGGSHMIGDGRIMACKFPGCE